MQPINAFWIEQISQTVINFPQGEKLSPAEVGRRLREIKGGPTPAPGNKTIGRYMARFIQKPEKEKERFRFFRWPDAMESGAFPWEASRACLDALAYLRDHLVDPEHPAWLMGDQDGRPLGTFIPEDRPRIDFMQAYWRVTQAAADAPLSLRFLFVATGFTGSPELLEPCLVYSLWRSEAHAAAYARAVAKNQVPPFIDPELVRIFYTHENKAEALYRDHRMLYLYRMFGTNFFAGHIKEIETQWQWLASLCRRDESSRAAEEGGKIGRSSSRKNKK